jgi:hypothetical protein
MSDDKDFGFTDAEHNSGENIPQADIDQQPGISGWQGAVADQEDGTDTDPDKPAVE